MADADPVAIVYTAGAPLAVVALEPGVDGLRTAAARAVRACRGGGTVAWALDASLPAPRRGAGRARWPKAPSSAATTPAAGAAASRRAASSAS